MNLSAARVALGSALASWGTWLVTALEITVLRPHACSRHRMQFEAWLFLARAAASVMPVVGLLLALGAVRAPRSLRWSGIVANGAALILVAAMFMRLVPMGRLPCLRD